MRSKRSVLLSCLVAFIALFATAESVAGDTVSWTAIRGLFPGPKRERGVLMPEDLAPWRPQSVRQDGIAGVDFGAERTWIFEGHKTQAVALRMPFTFGCQHGPASFIVGVLDAKGKLIARSSELFSEGSDANATEKPYQIDTASYRLTDSETAFGLRIVHYHAGKHWCYADQVLHLFRVVDQDVVRILETDAFYEQLDQIELARQDTQEALDQLIDDPDCSFSYSGPFPPKGRAAVFRMLPSKTLGFYDIQRTQKGGPTVVFRWNGQRYLMEGKDPVDHHVREEWDWCTGRRYLERYRLPPPAAPVQRPAKD